MFSYLLTALAAALCLLGALMIYANFHFLLEQQRGKNTSFMPCLGAVFWCLGIYCIPKQYVISGYWYAVALLDIGVWILPLSLMYMINKARAHSPACCVAQFVRDKGDEHYCLSFYRNGDAVLSYQKSNESGSRLWNWERMSDAWRISSADRQIFAKLQGDKLVFANHAEGQQDGMFKHIIGQTFIQQAIQTD